VTSIADQPRKASHCKTESEAVLIAPTNVTEALIPDTIKPGVILIKEGTLLPETLRFESEYCVRGWRLVKDLDRCGLARKIHEAGWTFFCLAGQLGATVFGIDEQKTLTRAVEQILAAQESAESNCLEIMRVDSEASKRFLALHYVTVSGQSRHIQESAPQSRDKDVSSRVRGPSLPLEPKHEAEAGVEMADKMYWTARGKKCREMAGYRDVRYIVDGR
jgi:hypothetical protein